MSTALDLAAGKRLRHAARAMVRRNAFIDLRAYDAAMPRTAFLAVLGMLVALRIYSIVCMIIAWQGWDLDPATWATGQPVHTDLVTPFHGHANPFGFVFQVFVTLHNITGGLLFATCLVPLFVRKGSRPHVLFGRVFVAIWLFHLVDGLSNSGRILIARGFDPLRYYEVTGQGFSLYLYIQFAFISALVIDFLAHGLAAIHYKNGQPSAGVRAVMLFLPLTSALFGLGIAVWGALRLSSGVPPETANTIPFAAVFIVQVPVYLYLLFRNLRYWARPTKTAWLHGWLMEHQRNMMFCVQVTLYTGIANVADRFAPVLTPILFGLIDVGFLVWIVTKDRALRRHVLKSRMSLALTTSLTRGVDGAGAEAVEADRAWIKRTFALDGGSEVSVGEIRGLLESQGVTPTAEELDALRAVLDRDRDGRIDAEELTTFLASWLVSYPSNEDELRLAYRGLDRDGDGRITADELRRALGEGDDALAAVEIDRMLLSIDRDRSGTIEWNEFVEAIGRRAEGTRGGVYLAVDTKKA